MIPNLPLYVSLGFIILTFVTIYLIYRASNNSFLLLIGLSAWIVLQGILSFKGFYTITNTLPPRFVLLAPPALVVIIILFVTNRGRRFIDDFNLRTLTWIHTIRIFVEISLWMLYKNGSVPREMTFEGGNFDILSGITAPLVASTAFKDHKINRGFLLLWNFVCLILLLKIVITAVLSVPTPFQQFAFNQHAVGVLYFPFTWLPCCIVPVVFFAHLAAIRKMITLGRNTDILAVK